VWRRDHKLFQKKFDQKRKTSGNGVVNRRNDCGSTVAAQRLYLIKTENPLATA
jgi:hypothetical protein